ncbi:NlpC/P60 family protein [Maribacter algarum]|uniref:NlpC/P60 family protein n=1 Tax=Maribacter algarum (ex Zhang et al. 2020) TaxID=2578118 RepID=A0A5S3PN00_9FLAO|nr:NlpC/P60 family protein [Maribacter algarum]TMM55854.1 NlpC/P60 family protein [Maribacter algarum]
MQYGICPLSVVPIRATADDAGEMVSQLLYGEHFKILEHRKRCSRIRLAFDGFEGWVSNRQIVIIEEKDYEILENSNNVKYSSDLISFVSEDSGTLLPIIIGSSVQKVKALPHTFEGSTIDSKREKFNLVQTALTYLNAPFLLGGRTPFGVDSSGFTQMVYKINGYSLKRKSSEQSVQGEALSFIEESEPGDLAFFDNKEGIIDHVGIIMKDNYIIHAFGKVRIDRLDHTGIFNAETRNYTHSLRVIKKMA